MFHILLAVLAFLIVWPVLGQVTSLTAPVSALVYDSPSRSIRPVVGLPGSSYLGQPTLSDLDKAFVAPDGNSALVVQNGEMVLVRGLRDGSLIRFSVTDLSAQVDPVSWALYSTALVAYSPSTRRLLRLDVRSAPPMLGPSVDLSNLEGDVSWIVTNNDATETVLGLRHPTRGGLYALTPGAPALQLRATTDPGAAVFGASSNVLYAIDRETGQVVRFPEGVHGGSEPLSFSGESGPMTDPVGLALSRDEQRLYVAGGVDQTIREYDLRSRELLREIRLDVVPRYLSSLAAAASVFVLAPRGSSEQPMWLLDGRSLSPVSFVPASK